MNNMTNDNSTLISYSSCFDINRLSLYTYIIHILIPLMFSIIVMNSGYIIISTVLYLAIYYSI